MKKQRSFGQITDVVPNEYKIGNGPLSSQFDPPVGNLPGDLVKYMLHCQSIQFGTTILEDMPNQRMHERHMKLLLKSFDPLILKRAIKLASLQCDHVYSGKQIKAYAERILEWFPATK